MNRWQAEYIARLDVDAGRFALAVESGATELPRLGVTDTEAAAIRGALEELRQNRPPPCAFGCNGEAVGLRHSHRSIAALGPHCEPI